MHLQHHGAGDQLLLQVTGIMEPGREVVSRYVAQASLELLGSNFESHVKCLLPGQGDQAMISWFLLVLLWLYFILAHCNFHLPVSSNSPCLSLPKMVFHHAGQAGLKLLTSGDLAASASQNAGITG
ncbi:hypothetical protein AAY473_034921, partial [Plecturocebus cupreus]